MKIKPSILTALAITAFATGCKQSNTADENSTATTNAWQQTKTAATNDWAAVKQGATNAWANTKEATTNAWADIKDSMQTSKDYTYDKKDAFVADASADLNTLDQKISVQPSI